MHTVHANYKRFEIDNSGSNDDCADRNCWNGHSGNKVFLGRFAQHGK